MIRKMMIAFGLALAMSFASSVSMAQTRCLSDSFGNTTCRDRNGNITLGSTDSFGNTTLRDSNGNTVRCSKNSFGNMICR